MATACIKCGGDLPPAKLTQASVACPTCQTVNDLTMSGSTMAQPGPRSGATGALQASSGKTNVGAGAPSRAVIEPTLVTPTPGKPKGAARRPKHKPHGRDLQGLKLDGKYEIVDYICAGGMGSVWLARDNMDRDVAVKVLLQNLSDDPEHREYFLNRFLSEAKILASTRHENLVSIYYLGEFPADEKGDGFPFLVMDYVVGPDGLPRSVADWIEAKKLSFDDAVRLFLETCNALEHVHKLGIWHRDIKPANILIDSDGHARLTDFGIACRKDTDSGRVTSKTDRLGSPDFMSPEQKNDPTSVDARSDIYSMGVTFAQMLSGELPGGQGWVLRGPMPGKYVKALDAVIKKAMASQPSRRYASAKELGDAVRTAVKSGGAGKKIVAVLVMLAIAAGGTFAGLRHGTKASSDNAGPRILASGDPGTLAPVSDSTSKKDDPPPARPAPKATYKDLLAALNTGDLARFDDILAQNPELAQAKDPASGRTMLHEVAATDKLNFFNHLVEKSNVNEKDNRGRMPIHYAAEAGDQEMVGDLMARPNSIVTQADGEEKTPAQLALARGFEPIAFMLGKVKFKEALDARNYRGKSDSLDALLAGNPALAKMQLDGSGLTALQVMAGQGDAEAVELLLANGALPNATTRDGRTALYMAADHPESSGPDAATSEQDRARVVRLLLAKGATVLLCNDTTPLHLAADRTRTDLMQAFVDDKTARLNLNMVAKGNTPLFVAIEKRRWPIARLLIEQTETLADWTDGDNCAALQRAAQAGNAATVMLLIDLTGERRVDLDRQTTSGKDTALMLAVKHNDPKSNSHLEVIQLLIGRDPRLVKIADKDGNTPLIVSAASGSVEVVNLLTPQSDLHAVNGAGRTALCQAAATGAPLTIVKALLDADKSPDLVDRRRAIALADAAKFSSQGDAIRATVTEPKPAPVDPNPAPFPPVATGPAMAPGEPVFAGTYEATVGGKIIALTFSKRSNPWAYHFTDQDQGEVGCQIQSKSQLMTLTSPNDLFPNKGAHYGAFFTYSGTWTPKKSAGAVTEFSFVPIGRAQTPIVFRRR